MATRRGNNEGSIVTRPGGKIQARVTVGVKDDGTPDRISKTFGANEKTLAREWIADQVSAMGRGVNLSARNTSWKELQDQWLATKKATVSDSSYQRAKHMANHIEWTTEPIKDCLPKIQAFINQKTTTHAPATVREIYSVVRGVLELAIERDIVFKAPRVRLPRFTERIPTLISNEQITFLLAASEKHKSKYSYGVWLELGTGLRRGEMLALNWTDVDFDNNTIAVNKGMVRVGNKYICVPRTKTKAGMRTVDVPQVIMDRLATKKATGKMFATEDGSYLAPNNWSRLFRSWRKQADAAITTHNKKNETNIGPVSAVRFHDLRHQFASIMLALGVQPRTTQQMTGHKDMTTLMQRYTHVTPDLTRDAADKLNEALKPLLN